MAGFSTSFLMKFTITILQQKLNAVNRTSTVFHIYIYTKLTAWTSRKILKYYGFSTTCRLDSNNQAVYTDNSLGGTKKKSNQGMNQC